DDGLGVPGRPEGPGDALGRVRRDRHRGRQRVAHAREVAGTISAASAAATTTTPPWITPRCQPSAIGQWKWRTRPPRLPPAAPRPAAVQRLPTTITGRSASAPSTTGTSAVARPIGRQPLVCTSPIDDGIIRWPATKLAPTIAAPAPA